MTATAELPVEGRLPDLGGATGWLHSEPLTPAALRGRVVVAQFCTFSCVNWLRTLPYVRAWAERYRDEGLVMLGVHTPEFAFEHDAARVRRALAGMGVDYPIAMDNDFAVWSAFANRAWPALYFADAEGRIRHHHLGEEDYERSERVIQALLAEAGRDVGDRDLVAVEPAGVELAADWGELRSPETYVGYARSRGLASPGGVQEDRRGRYEALARLALNEWSLSGEWTVREESAILDEPGGRIAFRFHGRDLNLVLGSHADGGPVRFAVRIDGEPPGAAQGVDVDEQGEGTIVDARMYNLVRHRGPAADRTVELEFADAGAEAYVFTFG